ncbi:hypothetical protein DFH07DRAFT_119575 [Mycena maculata]|uniref:Uncharacterized protein n=1 Tax=Mycena maculata TaxID=230809 RepID=A0AAD7MVQ2_9AGAR|nr:hypothetical protein DFH07DRAFT_119575 [Mycena maculata]
MSSIANLPILVLVSNPSLAGSTERPAEREIDRNALVAISPDREELLFSKKSIEELRQVLKLRTGPKENHWLYQHKQRPNATFRDATARTSALIHRVRDGENKAGDAVNAVRRVLSVSSLNRASMPLTRIENRIPGRSEANGVNVWGSFILSTEKKLISPRPLGPTHILVVHSQPLSVSKSGKNTLPRPATKPSFPNMDIPINDLIFMLNAPNLVPANGRCPLPHRLHHELPRALLRVPYLETISELIVYLHTHNQAELFRALVPEWLRDLMHPLPAPALPGAKDTASRKQRSPASLFGILASSTAKLTLSSSASSIHSLDTLASGSSGHSGDLPAAPERTADAIARDIVDSLPFFSDEDPAKDELVAALTTLNALKANLEFFGYFGKAVWDELEACIGILTRALVHRASITDPAGN